MVTIHREQGLRFVIYTDDHEPAHVHVYGDGEAKITVLGSEGRPELVFSVGFKTGERRRATDVVLEQQALFLARWDEIQGMRR